MSLTFLIAIVGTEKVCWLDVLEKHRSSVEFIGQLGNAHEFILVDRTQEWKFGAFTLEDLLSIRTHVSYFGIREELALWQLLLIVKVPLKQRSHSEVIHIKWFFINVLKKTEPSIFQRKLDSFFEVLIRIDSGLFWIFTFNCSSIYDLEW